MQRRDWLRNHPDDATTEEHLIQARAEIQQLLRANAQPAANYAEMANMLTSSGLPVKQLLLVADMERSLRTQLASQYPCGRNARSLMPLGPTFDTMRSDLYPTINASMLHQFAVQFCQNGSVLHIKLTRRVNCRGPRAISKSTTSLRQFLQLGPDEIVVMLEGAELLPCTVVHLGICTYVASCAPIPPSGGRYHLVAMHMRSNYDAVDEFWPRWPPAQFDHIVGDYAFVNLSKHGRRPNVSDPDSIPCDERHGRLVARGRWVASIDDSLPDRPIGKVTRKGQFMRELWVPRDGYTWRPYSCTMVNVSLTHLTTSLSMASIRHLHIVGDSHAATLFMQIMSSLNWPANSTFTNPSAKGYMHDNAVTEEVQGVQMHKNANPKLASQSPAIYGAGNHSLVLVNFGHHNAAARQSLEDFRLSVVKWTKRVLAWRAQGQNRKVFWLKGVLSPPRTDGYVRGFKDGRSVHRMKVYMDTALKLVQRAGIPSIDNFAPTEAYLMLQKDAAHYTGSPIEQFLPHVVLSQLCAALQAHDRKST